MLRAIGANVAPSRLHRLTGLRAKIKLQNNFTNSRVLTSHRSNIVEHLPPLIIRVGIVSSAVGLATPVFATAGIVRLWYAYLPRTFLGYNLKVLLTIFGGGGIINVLYNYVIPFFRDHSDLIMPFALANAVASGGWLVVGELTFGLPFMVGVASLEALSNTLPAFIMAFFVSPAGKSLMAGGLPIGGVAIGGLTALTAPFLWPMAFSLCWDDDFKALILDGNYIWPLDFYLTFLLPLGIPVGVISGLSMHLLLKDAIIGRPNMPWKKGSLPVLTTLVGLSFSYFYLLRPSPGVLQWESRMDHITGEIVSYNPTTRVVSRDTTLAQTASMQRDFAIGVHSLKAPITIIQKKDTTPMRPIDTPIDNSMTINNISDRQDVFSIIDILVRMQYLQALKPGKEMKELKEKAAATFGVTDLESFKKAVELKIISDRRKPLHQNPNSTGTNSIDISRNLNEDLVAYCNAARGSRGDKSMRVFFNNLAVLESEFFEKLGYKIADTPEKEVAMIQSYQYKQLVSNVVLYGGVIALIGLGASYLK